MTHAMRLAVAVACLAPVVLAEDAYLQSSGANYLDTDYCANADSRIEVDFQFLDIGTTQPRVFGVENAETLCPVVYVNGSKNFAWSYKDKSISGNVMMAADTARHTVIIDAYHDKTYLVTGAATNYTADITTPHTLTCVQPLRLFTQNCGTFQYGTAKEKIYGVRIYEKDELVRDYEPCVQDGIAGLKDRVTGVFLSSLAGGQLTAGGDVATVESPYIQSTGANYIDTGYYPSQVTRLVAEFSMVETGNVTQPRICGSNGLRYVMYLNGNGKYAFSCFDSDGGLTSGIGYQTNTGISKDTDVRHTFNVDRYAMKADLVTGAITNYTATVTSVVTNETASGVLYLFNGKDWDQKAKMKLYRFRIYEQGTLVRDYLPYVQDGVVGLKDQVTGQFLTSATATAFTAGGDVESGSSSDEAYVESLGTGYIDTGYLTTPKTRLEMDFEMVATNNVTQPRLCGCKTGFRHEMYVNGKTQFAFSCWDDETATSGTGYQTATGYAADIGVRHQFAVDAFTRRAELRTAGKVSKSFVLTTVLDPAKKATDSVWVFSGRYWDQKSKMKLYGFRIYESGVLVRNYIPCVKRDVPGIYDTINGQFLGFNADGAATYGGNIRKEITDAYLESDGTQAILSDYYPSPATKVVADFAFTEVDTVQQRPFGCDSDSASNPLSFSVYLNGGNNLAWAFCDGIGNWSATWKPLANVRYTVTLDGPGNVFRMVGDVTDRSSALGTTRTGTSVNPMGIFGDYEKGKFCRVLARMRLYSLKCYDNGELVRQFLPYQSGDRRGLYETVQGKAFLNGTTGTAPFKIGGVGSDGTGLKLVVTPQDVRARRDRPRILTAFASGDVTYRWYRDGAEIPGETAAELAVSWNGTGGTETYGVRAVAEIGGVVTEGELASCVVSHDLPGLLILVK